MADVDRLVEELEGFPKTLMVGFNRRFDHSHDRLKQLIDAGRIGKVEMVSIISRDPNPPPIDYMRSTPGGIFYDTMIHDFDIARWLLGESPPNSMPRQPPISGRFSTPMAKPTPPPRR
jgi:myo-inositol 2-dehydrogenase / D-chiro-inositol 1-dehydrogenase